MEEQTECGPGCWVRFGNDPHDCSYLGLNADGSPAPIDWASLSDKRVMYEAMWSTAGVYFPAHREEALAEAERRGLLTPRED